MNDWRPQEKEMELTEMYKSEVDRLFREAPDRTCPMRRNPVTGGWWVPGVDPIRRQKRLAKKAFEARAWFAPQRPADAPDLPLAPEDRERYKIEGVGYIVSLLARSLAMRDYETDGHPCFEEYARGVMASPLTPDFVRDDPELLKRYPPSPLTGLGGGLIWRQAHHCYG